MEKVKGKGNYILVGSISYISFINHMGVEIELITKRFETVEKAQKEMFRIFKKLLGNYTQRFKGLTLKRALERNEFDIEFEEEYDPDEDEDYARHIDEEREAKEGCIEAGFHNDNMYFDITGYPDENVSSYLCIKSL